MRRIGCLRELEELRALSWRSPGFVDLLEADLRDLLESSGEDDPNSTLPHGVTALVAEPGDKWVDTALSLCCPPEWTQVLGPVQKVVCMPDNDRFVVMYSERGQIPALDRYVNRYAAD